MSDEYWPWFLIVPLWALASWAWAKCTADGSDNISAEKRELMRAAMREANRYSDGVEFVPCEYPERFKAIDMEKERLGQ